LGMCHRAISEGAAGVDMGRNIFQAGNPVAMCRAVGRVVHDNFTAKEAFQFYQDYSKGSKDKGAPKAKGSGKKGKK